MTTAVASTIARDRVAHEGPPNQRHARQPSWLLACILLLAIYAALGLVKNPMGDLAPDSGGKLATLQAGAAPLRVGVGYWASTLDPEGRFHPLQYTRRFEHGWIEVSTLPMILATTPIVEMFGLRAALVIPMLSGVACALAAAALARRRRGSQWAAFWAVGLATPVAVYALDFWEHVPGLALMLWGTVLLVDWLDTDSAIWRAAAAGACFGAAATMRTEALIYLVVAGLVVSIMRSAVGVRRRVVEGVAYLSGAIVLLVANMELERIVLGADQRGSRTVSALSTGRSLTTRGIDVLTGSLGVTGNTSATEWLLGAAVVGFTALGVIQLRSSAPDSRRIGVVLLAVVGFVYVLRFSANLGFVPGMLTASPLATAGLVLAWRRAELRVLVAIALLPLPLIWWFQSGGLQPQWGNRYELLSGALLAVAFFCVPGRPRAMTVAVCTLALIVTGAGVAMTLDRADTTTRGMQALLDRRDDAIVSMQPNLLREVGAYYTASSHWLTVSDGDLRGALRVVELAGDRSVAVVRLDGVSLPARIGDFEQTSSSTALTIRPGERLRLTEYRRAPAG